MAKQQQTVARIRTIATAVDLNRVSIFVRVVESASFTAAARALALPKSSVSRAVATLEESLGVRLLQRTTRKLQLTDAGRVYHQRVRGAVAGIHEATVDVADLGNEPRGLVRLTAPHEASQFLPEILAPFVKRYPGVQIELSLTGRYVDLVQEGFDLAVRAGRLVDSSLIARKIGDSDAALFAAPSYLRRRKRPASFADLANHDFVVHGGVRGRTTLRMVGPAGPESVEVSGPLAADELAFVLKAATIGVGIAILPEMLGADAVARGRLARVLPEYHLSGGGLFIVLPSTTNLPARVALLRDFLTDEIKRWHLRCDGKGKRPMRARSSSPEDA